MAERSASHVPSLYIRTETKGSDRVASLSPRAPERGFKPFRCDTVVHVPGICPARYQANSSVVPRENCFSKMHDDGNKIIGKPITRYAAFISEDRQVDAAIVECDGYTGLPCDTVVRGISRQDKENVSRGCAQRMRLGLQVPVKDKGIQLPVLDTSRCCQKQQWCSSLSDFSSTPLLNRHSSLPVNETISPSQLRGDELYEFTHVMLSVGLRPA